MNQLRNYKFLLGALFLIVLLVIVYNHYFFDPDIKPKIRLKELTNIQESALEKLSQMIELLISLGTAIFAVVGYFAIEQFKSLQEIKGRMLFYAGSSLSLAALSIDYGYFFTASYLESHHAKNEKWRTHHIP